MDAEGRHVPAALQPPLQAALEGGPVGVRALAADAAATTHAATRVQTGSAQASAAGAH